MTEDKTAEFFIELLSEEMPARMQRQAESDFQSAIGARLDKAGLLDSEDTAHADSYEVIAPSWSTPRRLAVCFPKVRVIEPAREEEKRGPRADAPAEAVNGFLRSAGITKKEAEIRKTPKGEFYFAVQKHKGRKAADILPILIAEVIADFKWPKSMRWGTGQKRWVRPLHGIVALFDGKALNGEVDFGGEQKIYLGNKTRGHRFLDDNNLVTITSGATYEETMKKHFVIVSRYERRQMIEGQIKGQDEEKKLTAQGPRDAHRQQIERQYKENEIFAMNHPFYFRLLAEAVGLVEHPHVVQIEIDEEFKTLPDHIRANAMGNYQEFFRLYDLETREFLPDFVMVADSKRDKKYTARNERIRIGAERVMRARLADLRFSLEEDKKTGLDAMRERLDDMTFFNGLGTMGDKTERLIKLMQDYAGSYGVDKGEIEKVARYAKADLTSRTVNEFPKLQGFIGGHLAREKYGDTVADAISGHYFSESKFLGNDSGQGNYLKDRLERYLGLMDMIDTLAAFLAIGKMPTGSKDPYALRRAAQGISIIIFGVEDSASLEHIFYKALDYLEKDGVRLSKPCEELYDDFIFFLHDRVVKMIEDRGSKVMFFNAVFHRDTKDKDDIKYLYHLAILLRVFKTEGKIDDFIIAYKRLANILDAEDKKGTNQWGSPESDLFDPSYPDEKNLDDVIKKVSDAISIAERNASNAFVGTVKAISRAAEEIRALKRLTAPINAFLDAVRVNDEDPKIRQNRLNLLHFARTEIKKVADFDKIQ